MILIYIIYINKKTLPNIRIYWKIKTLLSLIMAYCQNTLYTSWIYAISNKWLRQIVTIYKIYLSKLLITYIRLIGNRDSTYCCVYNHDDLQVMTSSQRIAPYRLLAALGSQTKLPTAKASSSLDAVHRKKLSYRKNVP